MSSEFVFEVIKLMKFASIEDFLELYNIVLTARIDCTNNKKARNASSFLSILHPISCTHLGLSMREGGESTDILMIRTLPSHYHPQHLPCDEFQRNVPQSEENSRAEISQLACSS